MSPGAQLWLNTPMSYIARAISSREKLLAISRPHWIYVAKGAAWLIFCVLTGLALEHFLYVYFGRNAINFNVDLWLVEFNERRTPFPWIFDFMGVVMFWSYFSIYVSHEVGLTDQRYIYKKGLFFITVEQVDLEDIRAEDVHHGLLGWLFRYGYIHLDALFTEDLYLPAMSKPYALIKESHKARAKQPQTKYDKEELEVNLERISQQEDAARAHVKIKALHDRVLRVFRKAA